jgi:hypothetical protein
MVCPHCGEKISRFSNGIKRNRAKKTFFRGEHEYLVGVLAHTKRRIEIFENAGGEVAWFDPTDPSTVEEIRPATCQLCTEPHLVGWTDGEWHHNVKSHGGKRCDCAKCGLYACRPSHLAWHNRVIEVRFIR